MSRRKEPSIPNDILDQLLAGTDAAAALSHGGLLDSLKKAFAERALNAEMDHHLGQEEQGNNSRNGYGRKTVTTDGGRIEIEVPRDRAGSFDPQLIAKYQRRFPGFDDKIISMYARGMSTREITGQLRSLGLSIVVHQDRIEASVSQRLLVALLDGTASAAEDHGVRIPIAIPTKPDRRGHNLKLVLRSDKQRPAKIDPDLIALLQKAEATRQQLFATDAEAKVDRESERIARLAFLAPDIIAAILEGRQPPSLTSRRLFKYASIPLDWKSQRQALGF